MQRGAPRPQRRQRGAARRLIPQQRRLLLCLPLCHARRRPRHPPRHRRRLLLLTRRRLLPACHPCLLPPPPQPGVRPPLLRLLPPLQRRLHRLPLPAVAAAVHAQVVSLCAAAQRRRLLPHQQYPLQRQHAPPCRRCRLARRLLPPPLQAALRQLRHYPLPRQLLLRPRGMRLLPRLLLPQRLLLQHRGCAPRRRQQPQLLRSRRRQARVTAAPRDRLVVHVASRQELRGLQGVRPLHRPLHRPLLRVPPLPLPLLVRRCRRKWLPSRR